MSKALISSAPGVPVPPVVTPAQVWAALATDLQVRAIWLLAQLAFNQIAAQAPLCAADQASRAEGSEVQQPASEKATQGVS